MLSCLESPAIVTRMRRSSRFLITTLMIGMAGLFCLPAAHAQAPLAPPTQPSFDPSDVYFQGWIFTREAETLMKAGRHAEAIVKLRSAQKFFQTVNQFHPEWKKDMVTGRLDITTKDIAKVLPLAQAEQQKNEVAVAEIEGGARIPVKPLTKREPQIEPNVTIADARVQSLEAEVKRLRSALAVPANNNSRDAARASDLEKQRNDVSAQLKEAQTSLATMRAQMATAPVQSEMDRMNARIRSVEQERDAMAMALTSSRGEQLNSLAKINTLSADLQVMRQQAADLERNLSTERKVSNEVTKRRLIGVVILFLRIQECFLLQNRVDFSKALVNFLAAMKFEFRMLFEQRFKHQLMRRTASDAKVIVTVLEQFFRGCIVHARQSGGTKCRQRIARNHGHPVFLHNHNGRHHLLLCCVSVPTPSDSIVLESYFKEIEAPKPPTIVDFVAPVRHTHLRATISIQECGISHP